MLKIADLTATDLGDTPQGKKQTCYCAVNVVGCKWHGDRDPKNSLKGLYTSHDDGGAYLFKVQARNPRKALDAVFNHCIDLDGGLVIWGDEEAVVWTEENIDDSWHYKQDFVPLDIEVEE